MAASGFTSRLRSVEIDEIAGHGVGHELIARQRFKQPLLQRVARVGGALIILFDILVGVLAAQLPGNLSPDHSHDGAVRLLVRIAGGNLRADEDGSPDVLGDGKAHFLDQFDAGQVAGGVPENR